MQKKNHRTQAENLFAPILSNYPDFLSFLYWPSLTQNKQPFCQNLEFIDRSKISESLQGHLGDGIY